MSDVAWKPGYQKEDMNPGFISFMYFGTAGTVRPEDKEVLHVPC